MLQEITDANFDQLVRRSGKPVFLIFYAPACPHCGAIEPSVRRLAEEYREAMVFARLNSKQNREIAERYGIESTPSFMILCSGRPFQLMAGASPVLLKRMIEDAISSGTECLRHTTPIAFDFSD
jgi:thioredoxin 1